MVQSGIRLKFMDKGEMFVTNKKIIKMMPLYARCISITKPNWEQKDAEFTFDIKLPFAQKTFKFFMGNVLKYIALPKPGHNTIVKDLFPETAKKNLEELRELAELAHFCESIRFEQIMYLIIREKLERVGAFNPSDFLEVAAMNNSGLIVSTSRDSNPDRFRQVRSLLEAVE